MAKKIFYDFKSLEPSITNIRNKKIILCHGVFDLFHAGHLYSLKKAKEYGDILIVSLTSDRFVKKAPNRPFFKFDQRADVIAGLSVVDYIIKSDFETAIDVIKFIKPKIYFKGPDYKDLKKDITGKEIKTDTDFVQSLLENNGVAVVQGSAFGLEGFFRISYATSMENLKKGLEKISNFCKTLS